MNSLVGDIHSHSVSSLFSPLLRGRKALSLILLSLSLGLLSSVLSLGARLSLWQPCLLLDNTAHHGQTISPPPGRCHSCLRWCPGLEEGTRHQRGDYEDREPVGTHDDADKHSPVELVESSVQLITTPKLILGQDYQLVESPVELIFSQDYQLILGQDYQL